MTRNWPAILTLAGLTCGVPAVAQEQARPEPEATAREAPVVRRFPAYYQSYARPGGPWSGSYRGFGYYILDEDGVPVGRKASFPLTSRDQDLSGGSYLGPPWLSGFDSGWEFAPTRPSWRGGGWNAWGAGWTGWSAGPGRWWARGDRPERLDRGRREPGPRPDSRRE